MPEGRPTTLGRVAYILDQLVERVSTISLKLDKLTDEKVSTLVTEHALTRDRLSRLEKIVYGCLAALALETLGLIVVWLTKTKTTP